MSCNPVLETSARPNTLASQKTLPTLGMEIDEIFKRLISLDTSITGTRRAIVGTTEDCPIIDTKRSPQDYHIGIVSNMLEDIRLTLVHLEQVADDLLKIR
jgi:hypothetical protein